MTRVAPTLTEKQETVLAWIKRHMAEHGFSPTTREIAQAFGYTQTAAINHVKALERKGRIRTTPKVARSIVVL